ncbi:MAG: RteC domain-containing protein [Bacteroidota bacterium]|nr:RteC domain-containing protein [Bacteroidota bacterium]
MNQKAEQLYEAMLQDMEHCRRKAYGRVKELECLFHICNRYWAIVQSEAENYEFESEEEEVIFFKIMKPKFVSERLYCGLASHALLFKEDTNDPARLKKFLDNELLRLEKFITMHAGFYEYYKSGNTSKDNEWFTRKRRVQPGNLDDRVVTLQDQQVSNLLALERYTAYIKEEMKTMVMQ